MVVSSLPDNIEVHTQMFEYLDALLDLPKDFSALSVVIYAQIVSRHFFTFFLEKLVLIHEEHLSFELILFELFFPQQSSVPLDPVEVVSSHGSFLFL